MKQCLFIRAEGRVWVPQPSSWLGGWARHRWLERHFGEGVLSIASAESWARLIKEHEPSTLQEENNNFIEINP